MTIITIKNRLLAFGSLACLSLVATLHVKAQVTPIDKEAPPLEISLSVTTNDNLNPTVNDELQSTGLSFSPSGSLIVANEGIWWMLDYDASFERFKLDEPIEGLEEDQNFNAYRALGLSRIFLSDSWFVDLEFQHAYVDQKYGQGISRFREGQLEVDELTQNQGALMLVYGSDTSSRYLSFRLQVRDDEYADITPESTLFNLTQTSFNVDFALERSNLTRYIVKLSALQDDYEAVTRSDSSVYRALAGIEWKPSGSSTIEALVGAFQRNIDDGEGDETSNGFSYQFAYRYSPRENVEFSLTSSRTSEVPESELAISSIVLRHIAALDYAFNDRWHLALDFTSSQSEQQAVLSSRDLDELTYKVRVGYRLRSYNEIFVTASSRDVSTSDDLVDYTQNEVRLGWRYHF